MQCHLYTVNATGEVGELALEPLLELEEVLPVLSCRGASRPRTSTV